MRPVRSRADERQFVDFVYTHYRDAEHWVPPLRLEQRKLIDTRKNPFYRHAERELFLAERAGRVVGRIGAIVNHNHNRHNGDRAGFFGFFESIEDPGCGRGAGRRGQGVPEEPRHGRDARAGQPLGERRVRPALEGFDEQPALMMPYNPPFYGGLLEGCGLRKAKDLYAYRASVEGPSPSPRSRAPTKS